MINFIEKLPKTKGVVVILSGGMDSTIAMRLCVEAYGAENVRALTFDYGQKQIHEIKCARDSTALLGVKHKVMDLSALGNISLGFSANVDDDMDMPTIQDVLGDPRPKTYVPNRNMILMSLAAAFAEVEGIDTVIMGLQVHDEYNYHDTTQRFVDKVNDVLSENRIIKIKIIAPFSLLSKREEIEILLSLDNNIALLYYTMTCYNPLTVWPQGAKLPDIASCGACPSCSERIANFAKAGIKDPIKYAIDIPWNKLIEECAQ
jgi:7-cyano-7-deazaguanine synthase